MVQELQRSHLDSRQLEVILKAAGTHRPYAVAIILSRAKCVMHMSEWNMGVKCMIDGYLAMWILRYLSARQGY